MNFIVSLPKVRRCDSGYVVVDRLRKYAFLYYLFKLHNSRCGTLISHVWKPQGLPKTIVTDRVTKFVGPFLRAFMGRLKIHHNRTTANQQEAEDACKAPTAASYKTSGTTRSKTLLSGFLPFHVQNGFIIQQYNEPHVDLRHL